MIPEKKLETTPDQRGSIERNFADQMGAFFGEPEELSGERAAEETIYNWDGGEYHE